MSKDISAAEAGFLEPVATVVRGMKRLRVKPGETVVVIGAGTMGILNAQVAKAFGAHVIVSELTQKSWIALHRWALRRLWTRRMATRWSR